MNKPNDPLVDVAILFIYLLFRLFNTSDFSIQEITIGTKLTWHWKIRDQTDTIKKLGTKLKYSLKDMDQICSLPTKKKRREREREREEEEEF